MKRCTKTVEITEQEHGELCIYLDEWLHIWNAIPNEKKTNWEYAKQVSDTLGELLAQDAIDAGL